MKPPLSCVLAPFLLFVVLGHASSSASAQGNGSSKPASPGWTSSWTDGIAAQQQKDRELTTRYTQSLAAKNYSEALHVCEQAVADYPSSPTPYAMRALVLLKLNRLEPASQDIDRGLRLTVQEHKPVRQAPFLRLRAELHARQMLYPATLKDLQAALKLTPRDPAEQNAMAWLRATCPVTEVRNGPEAVRLARKALTLLPERPYRVFDTLAAAYAESNDYPHAVESEQRALAEAQKAVPKDAAAATFLRSAPARLQLFERNQPYHRDTFLD